MDKEKFSQVEEILKNSKYASQGPLELEHLPGVDIINMKDVILPPEKRNYIVHVRYVPKREGYAFTVYEEDKE